MENVIWNNVYIQRNKYIDGAIKYEHSRETGNIGYTRRSKTKQKHNTMSLKPLYAKQTQIT